MRRMITWDPLTLGGYFEGPKRWDLGRQYEYVPGRSRASREERKA